MPARFPLWLSALAIVAIPLAMDPSSVRPFVGPKLAVALALGSLAPAAACLTGMVGRSSKLFLATIGAHVVALIVATLLSVVPRVSALGDYWRGTGLVTRLAALALALVAGGVVARRPRDGKILLRVIVATLATIALVGMAQVVGVDPFFDQSAFEQINRSGVSEIRLVATIGHANFVGHLLLFGAGAAIALAGWETRTPGRWFAFGGGVVIALGILASGSRGAWLGLGVQLVVLSWFALKMATRTTEWRRLAGYAAAGLLALTLAAIAVSHTPIGEQVALRAEAFRSDGMTGSSRTLLWRDAMPLVTRFALHGCGPDTFVMAFAAVESAELERREPYALYDSSHNVLLDAAILWGLGGLATLVMIAVVAFRAIARLWRATPAGSARLIPIGLALALVGYAVDGMFVFDTIPTAFYFYLFVAFVVGLDGDGLGLDGDGSGLDEDGSLRRRASLTRRAAAGALGIAAIAIVWPRMILLLRADRQIASALQLAASGKLNDAVAEGRAAVSNAQRFGIDSDMQQLLARIYGRAGDSARSLSDDERIFVEAGIAWLDRALETSITPQLILAERADLRLRLAQTEHAVDDLRAAIEFAPAFWPARARLARLLLETGKSEEARRQAMIAFDYNPEDPETRAVLAETEAR